VRDNRWKGCELGPEREGGKCPIPPEFRVYTAAHPKGKAACKFHANEAERLYGADPGFRSVPFRRGRRV
jgi:hypothetical protein